jgi:hypothetical protein
VTSSQGPTKIELSNAGIAQRIEAIRSQRIPTEHLERARHDWRQYVFDEFQLDSHQQRLLASVSERNVSPIQDAVRQVLEYGGQVELKLRSESDSKDEHSQLLITVTGSPDRARRAGDIFRCEWNTPDDCECEWFPRD